jgi:hypothetical protein
MLEHGYLRRRVEVVLFDSDGTETPGGEIQLWQDAGGRLDVRFANVPSTNLSAMRRGIPSPWPRPKGLITPSHEGQFLNAVGVWIERTRKELQERRENGK